MKARALEIERLPFPRSVLESPQIEMTRRAYKALGKDPARYRGSAEALLRRVVAGKGLPLFADDQGPHGSATSDSERTMVTSKTEGILAVIVSFGGAEGLDRWTQRMSTLLSQYASAQKVETRILA